MKKLFPKLVLSFVILAFIIDVVQIVSFTFFPASDFSRTIYSVLKSI